MIVDLESTGETFKQSIVWVGNCEEKNN